MFSRRAHSLASLVMMILATSSAGHAIAQSLASELHWEPAEPVQGTLFIVHVADMAGDLSDAAGTAAGEPLHFFRGDDGVFRSLAAAPLDRGSALELDVMLWHADGRSETLHATVPIRHGDYPMERLTVAPRFVAPADPAMVHRQQVERQQALDVSRRAHDTPRHWDEVVLPSQSRITSGFGSGREFNGSVQSRHTGVDFAGAVGAPVHAAANGVVALVDNFSLAGRVIYINHGAGLVTGYFHLNEVLVSEGDTVSAGDFIGRVGATGRVTGPHLHWLVRYGTISVDGLGLIEVQSRLAAK